MNISKAMCLKNFHKEYRFKTRKIVDEQIDNFFSIEELNFVLPKHKYSCGDNVVLDTYHYLHGIGENENAVEFVAENGIIAKEVIGIKAGHSVKFVAGFWRVFEKTLLKDYIVNYSGMDVAYGNNGKIVPYGKLDEFVEQMRNVDHWKWEAESPMEIRFMPSLSRDINQYGFILNISSPEAQKLTKYDINTNKFSDKVKRSFGIRDLKDNRRHEGVFNYTKRASYVILGMNKSFIEGIVVGRKVEKNKECLEDLKLKFPNCYICNLDGKVILE